MGRRRTGRLRKRTNVTLSRTTRARLTRLERKYKSKSRAIDEAVRLLCKKQKRYR